MAQPTFTFHFTTHRFLHRKTMFYHTELIVLQSKKGKASSTSPQP